MKRVCELHSEEEIADQLADLAIRLHKRGLVKLYHQIVEARDELLLILDERAHRHHALSK